jgi:hypothetical protein
MVIKSIKSSSNNNDIDQATINVASLRDSINKDIVGAPTTSTAGSYDIKNKITLMQKYFESLDGTDPKAFERFEPIFRKMIHPNIVVESDDHPDMHYDDLLSLVRDNFLPSGCVSELLNTIDNGDGTITAIVNNHLPGESGDVTRQRAYFSEDGRVIRVSTKCQFGQMIDRVTALRNSSSEPSDVGIVVDRYRAFLEAFDGSDQAPLKIDDLYENLFHKDFVLVTEEGEKNLADFKSFTKATAEAGQRVEVESIEAVGPDLISLSFHVIKNSSIVLVQRIATIKDGRIIRSDPESDDDTTFTLVCSQNSSSERSDIGAVVDRYREFLEAFDGSDQAPSKVDGFYEHLFHKNFVFVTPEGEKNLTAFRSFNQGTTKAGHRLEVDSIEAVGPDQISLSFRVIKNSTIYVKRIATIEDGKIIRNAPESDDDTAFTQALRMRN